MTIVQKSLLVGLIQVLVVGVLGAKFMIDRATYPRVWVLTQPYDPDLPIRGRYVRIQARVEHDGKAPEAGASLRGAARARLEAVDGRLRAVNDDQGHHWIGGRRCGTESCWVLDEPLAYFIPEHVPDPSVQPGDEQLWVEVTVPPNGAPRPIRLGIKANGVIRPLELR